MTSATRLAHPALSRRFGTLVPPGAARGLLVFKQSTLATRFRQRLSLRQLQCSLRRWSLAQPPAVGRFGGPRYSSWPEDITSRSSGRVGRPRSASRVGSCGAPLNSRSVSLHINSSRRLNISFLFASSAGGFVTAGGSLPSAAARVPCAVPGVRTRTGVRRPAALTSATRSLALGSDFGLRRRSVGLVLPSAAWWPASLTSRSSGRVQRQRPASPVRHGAAPLNSRSVRPHISSFAPAAFLSVCIQRWRLRRRSWLLAFGSGSSSAQSCQASARGPVIAGHRR